MEDIMAEKKNLMTYEGLKQIESELENLKTVRRKENAQKIKEAREQGDLSENAEYDAAKEEQREIEARIEELEALLKHAEVADVDEADHNKVHVGSIVKVYDEEFDEEIEYYMVGTSEADTFRNRISNECPVGAALMGHVAGDEVSVETPAGVSKYKVISVSRREE